MENILAIKDLRELFMNEKATLEDLVDDDSGDSKSHTLLMIQKAKLHAVDIQLKVAEGDRNVDANYVEKRNLGLSLADNILELVMLTVPIRTDNKSLERIKALKKEIQNGQLEKLITDL